MGWVEAGSGRSDGGVGSGESGPRGLVRIPATMAGCRVQRQPQHSRDAGPEGVPVHPSAFGALLHRRQALCRLLERGLCRVRARPSCPAARPWKAGGGCSGDR